MKLSKMGSLYKNEIIKLIRKKSLIVTMIIAFLLMFAIGVFVKSFEDSLNLDGRAYEETDYSVAGVNDAYKAVKKCVSDLEKEGIGGEKVDALAKRMNALIAEYDAGYGGEVDYDLLISDINDLFDIYYYTDPSLQKGYYQSITGNEAINAPDDYTEYMINSAAMHEYRLVECKEEYLLKNSGDGLSGTVSSAMLSTAYTVNIILIIIIAGSTISHEISSGSIKSLIIAPVKRSKIYWAKFLAVISVSFAVFLLEFVFASLFSILLFGFNDTSFIFSNGVSVYSMNVYLKTLLSVLVSFITVVSFASIAMMLSSISRNTAVSVGGTMGIYYAGGIAASILEMFINPIFIKFIPFAHLNSLSTFGLLGTGDAVGSMFKYYIDREAERYNTVDWAYNFFRSSADISFSFSVVYLVIFSAFMLWIGYDAFTRRDI